MVKEVFFLVLFVLVIQLVWNAKNAASLLNSNDVIIMAVARYGKGSIFARDMKILRRLRVG
jgi:hypothetical protein